MYIETAAIILLAWNAITFVVMGVDKLSAKFEWRRVPEDTLITLAFAMGSGGIAIGSWLFNHKTQKRKFKILLPTAVVFNISLGFLLYHYDIPNGWWKI